MYVGLKMLRMGKFVVGTPDMPILEADNLMVENQLWMLLVVQDGKLVGYVSKEDVLGALPSRATTLSKHELNYLLVKLKLDKILRKDVPTISPQAEIEEAAHRMHQNNLPGLAVVDGRNKLLGYINRSVMLDVLVEEMGLAHGGSRIVFEVEDRTGVIREVSTIIADMGVSIIATGTFFHDGRRIVVIRVKTDDPGPVVKALTERGYSMIGPESFEADWCDL